MPSKEFRATSALGKPRHGVDASRRRNSYVSPDHGIGSRSLRQAPGSSRANEGTGPGAPCVHGRCTTRWSRHPALELPNRYGVGPSRSRGDPSLTVGSCRNGHRVRDFARPLACSLHPTLQPLHFDAQRAPDDGRARYATRGQRLARGGQNWPRESGGSDGTRTRIRGGCGRMPHACMEGGDVHPPPGALCGPCPHGASPPTRPRVRVPEARPAHVLRGDRLVAGVSGGSDGTRTRGLRLDRPAL